MRDYQRYAAVVAVFAAVLYAALLVAAFGMISLLADIEVIPVTDAGPLVGPGMAAAAVLLVFALLLWLGLRASPRRQRVALGYAAGTGIAAFLGFVAAGSVLYLLGNGPLFSGLTFAAAVLREPFAATTGILAFVVTLLYSLVLASRMNENGRPLWPWERPDE
ncbi:MULTISPECIES: DUF6121 family protein [unclassified Cryobacterium]|uniref:DUF6121 family protein n=1 Tax=unclassified Cryobacterium TaxID=2649013 RepID=UPI002AB5B5B5|nr:MULTISPECIES: DUF6121 family protein [unclassified Cryobacterium]MDY7541554.1 DUF6121 family protein [Cryobacterium sp. 5B3]MEA9998027.1 DUF6121 family protein [Cryobacterium sp. RTS3]MEB0265645.1 DUF6121 family protein [Cryobacterium sp. 10I5]MEB0274576.1 DUF6121 family protein [Cryobacterium sp. 5B3]